MAIFSALISGRIHPRDLVRTDGEVVASHTVLTPWTCLRPGYFEHDADGVWWHDFVEIVHNLLQKSGSNHGRY
jgi:sugar (pentulose or hexulose) kinase